MKYKILASLVVVTIVAMFLNTNNQAHGNRNGAPAGMTGSPGDGRT